jgi:putative mRNA 3-end processing factor
MPLLQVNANGLYCSAGDFYIDPWNPVPFAIVTHAHSDHARWGSRRYLAAQDGLGLLRVRLGMDAEIEGIPYGETRSLGGVRVSLHPAGHVLGSAQVRIEHRGEVWVVTGDYKRQPDPTCQPFEPVRCHALVTESTFGLPLFRWKPTEEIAGEINAWWRENQAQGRASMLYAYAVGKAQRVLAYLDPSIGPIFLHGAMLATTRAYREAGVALPPTSTVLAAPKDQDWSQAIILAPPSAHGSPWLRRFGDLSTAAASGWMRVRGIRRRKAMDRGFVLSDHVDWPALLQTIDESEAEQVFVTHGYTGPVVRYLRERGLQAAILETRFLGESLEVDEAPELVAAEETS